MRRPRRSAPLSEPYGKLTDVVRSMRRSMGRSMARSMGRSMGREAAHRAVHRGGRFSMGVSIGFICATTEELNRAEKEPSWAGAFLGELYGSDDFPMPDRPYGGPDKA